MQLGIRWSAGDTPPSSVPEVLHGQLRAVEAILTADPFGGPPPKWTLTWLEGRPVAQLDTGVVVTVDPSGEVVVRHDSDEQFSNRDHTPPKPGGFDR